MFCLTKHTPTNVSMDPALRAQAQKLGFDFVDESHFDVEEDELDGEFEQLQEETEVEELQDATIDTKLGKIRQRLTQLKVCRRAVPWCFCNGTERGRERERSREREDERGREREVERGRERSRGKREEGQGTMDREREGGKGEERTQTHTGTHRQTDRQTHLRHWNPRSSSLIVSHPVLHVSCWILRSHR